MTKEKKEKTEEINWFHFYLYVLKWNEMRLNLSSRYTTYHTNLAYNTARGIYALILLLILVLTATIGALIGTIQAIIIYVILEITATTVVYFVTNDGFIYNNQLDKYSAKDKLIIQIDNENAYSNVMDSYKAFLKREELSDEESS